MPEDAYISELVASLNQINAGVTTTVDTSQVSLSQAHTDACIAGLKESGRRERALAGEKNLPRLLTTRDTLGLATIEGARTAHLDAKIGTLAPGKEADIILLATDRINVFP